MPRRCGAINQRGVRCANPATRRMNREGVRAHFCAACDARVNPSYVPPAKVARVAARALELRRQYRRGGTEVGVARARDLANRRPLRRETIERMVSYFQRHEVDRLAYGFYPGEDDYPSAGRIAWDLWGGDAGREWAARIVGKERQA